MPGYPRVVGAPGAGRHSMAVRGYVAGEEPEYHPGVGDEEVIGYTHEGEPIVGKRRHHHHHHRHHTQGLPEHLHPQSPPWRAMVAPGSPPVGEGHVVLPMNAETFGGTWGAGATPAGAPAGAQIIFSARPQKPFKTARLLIRGTKVGTTAVGSLIGQVFVGTDLQQGEVGNIDLESVGAANAFDTWVSFKQAEPGVWIRVLATLTAFPTGTDFETYTVNAIGHYLH